MSNKKSRKLSDESTWIFIGTICNTIRVLYKSITLGIPSNVAIAMNHLDMSYEMM